MCLHKAKYWLRYHSQYLGQSVKQRPKQYLMWALSGGVSAALVMQMMDLYVFGFLIG